MLSICVLIEVLSADCLECLVIWLQGLPDSARCDSVVVLGLWVCVVWFMRFCLIACELFVGCRFVFELTTGLFNFEVCLNRLCGLDMRLWFECFGLCFGFAFTCLALCVWILLSLLLALRFAEVLLVVLSMGFLGWAFDLYCCGVRF